MKKPETNTENLILDWIPIIGIHFFLKRGGLSNMPLTYVFPHGLYTGMQIGVILKWFLV